MEQEQEQEQRKEQEKEQITVVLKHKTFVWSSVVDMALSKMEAVKEDDKKSCALVVWPHYCIKLLGLEYVSYIGLVIA